MNQNAKGKKKDPFEHLELLQGSNLKMSLTEDGRVKVRGSAGYETVFIKKPVQEGVYHLEIEDLTFKERKPNPKACCRVGVYCHTEEADSLIKPAVYSLGSSAHSIAYRVKDRTVISEGKAIFRPAPQGMEIELSDLNAESQSETGDKGTVYSLLLGVVNPKNPQLIKYFKNKLDPVQLTTSSESFIAFLRNGVFECGFKGLREGTYWMGLSLFNEAQVAIDLDTEFSLEGVKETRDKQQVGSIVNLQQYQTQGQAEALQDMTLTELVAILEHYPVQSLRSVPALDPPHRSVQKSSVGVMLGEGPIA